jgi:hypothetical protein
MSYLSPKISPVFASCNERVHFVIQLPQKKKTNGDDGMINDGEGLYILDCKQTAQINSSKLAGELADRHSAALPQLIPRLIVRGK